MLLRGGGEKIARVGSGTCALLVHKSFFLNYLGDLILLHRLIQAYILRCLRRELSLYRESVRSI